MLHALQAIFPFAFPILWIGGTLVLFARSLAKLRKYLGHFPPVDGFPLDAPYYILIPMSMNPFGEVRRARQQAVSQPQTDPELERLRLDVWRSRNASILWMFLFPFVIFAVIFLLGPVLGILRG